MKKIVKMGYGFTRNNTALSAVTVAETISIKELFAKGLKKIKELASHVFVWFEFDDGERVYFEALIKKDWTGPHPISKAKAWAAAEPGRFLRMYDLTPLLFLSPEQMATRYRFAEAKLGDWRYNEKQLGLSLRTVRLTRKLFGRSFFKPSVGGVHCVESAGRVTDHPPFFDVLRLCGVLDYDHLNPAMLERAIVKAGVIDQDTAGGA